MSRCRDAFCDELLSVSNDPRIYVSPKLQKSTQILRPSLYRRVRTSAYRYFYVAHLLYGSGTWSGVMGLVLTEYKNSRLGLFEGACSLLFLHLVCLCCGPNRIRTYDPLLVRQVL